jgi:hypothetical protein
MSASASASATTFWNSTMLLTIFMVWPAPAGPQCVIRWRRHSGGCGEGLLGAANHDERAVPRRLAGARHRRVAN